MIEDLEDDDLVENFTIVDRPKKTPEGEALTTEPGKKNVQASSQKSPPKKTTVKSFFYS